MTEGVDGLLREATRPAGKPPLTPEVIQRVVEMTLAGPPGEATHWTGRAMAKAAGVSHRSVQRIWAAHGLKPPLGVLAQCGRRVLRQTDRAAAQARRLQRYCRSPGRH